MKSLFDLTGKVALVTGGNSGIGLGMADGLAMHGATVVIWGTNADRNAKVVKELSAHGGTVVADQIDVTDEAAVAAGIERIVADHGRLDQAIANAGIAIPRKNLFDISIEDFRRMEAVNLHGVLFTLREAARHMIARGEAGDAGGSLVSVASTAAIHGAARNEHYGATKGAVTSMTRAMAVELAQYKISVNCVLPGWTESGLTEKAMAWDKFNANVISRVPMGGWLKGSDFSAIAVYLASSASRYHTGDSIVIDGGYVIY